MYNCNVKRKSPPKRPYIGITQCPWKGRYNVHTHSFRNEKRKNDTELSKYIWKVKQQNENYDLEWSILKQIPSYSNKTKKCDLCLHEKLEIITYKDKDILLNKNNELISKCRHQNKFLLKNYKTND